MQIYRVFSFLALLITSAFTSNTAATNAELNDPGQPTKARQNLVNISDLSKPIKPEIWYWEDPSKSIAFTQARNFYAQDMFTQEYANFNFGYDSSNYWVVFFVKIIGSPSGSGHRDIILEFNYPHLDDAVLYRVDNDNTIHMLSTHGDKKPYRSRIIDSNVFITPDRIKIGEVYEYWVKMDTTSSTQLHPSIWDRDRYLESKSHTQIAYGGYFGLLVVMAIYNLFVGASTRDKSYFYYFGYISSFCILQACLWGYSYQYLWPKLPSLNDFAIPNSILLTLVFACAFTKSFLQTREYSPYLDRALLITIAVSCVAFVANFFVVYPLRVSLSVWMSLIGTIVLLTAAVRVLLKGHRFARLFLLAWTIMLIGAVIYGFTALGFLPSNFITRHSAQIGSALEVMLLSFALADRINQMKAEKRAIEKQAKDTLESKNLELEEALAQLKLSNTLKDEFLATISHELRTPMNGIEGSLQIVQQSLKDQELSKHLTAASHSAHHMTQLVESLLEYSELQSGNWKLNIQPFKFCDLIKKCTTNIQSEYVTKDVTFKCEGTTKLDYMVIGDSDRLHHLIFQLLDNAFKFTHCGDVSLTIDSKENDSSYDFTIAIQDSGIGIEEKQLKAIFEGFRQADGSFSRQYGGLGIGLSLCKAIVDEMDGEITVKSGKDQGTTFTIKLSLEKGQIIAKTTSAAEKLPNNPRVLVVEDNPVNQITLVAMMKKLGCQVEKANNGEEAVRIAANTQFDCILMDCQMPIMDGFDATKVIRKMDNGNQHIPIIAVTANAMSGDRDRCIAAGMNDYVRKPIKMDIISERLFYWLIDQAA
ncbi:MAG: ATP-binding protein [Pseudomonadales bacterium]|nr:ATP-binding protein [Pseudomonadales bacterium]